MRPSRRRLQPPSRHHPGRPPRPRAPRPSLRQRLAGSLEIPKDVVLDLPRIIVLGDLQVTVENHRGVVHYSPERVVVGMGKGRIHVAGRDLVIGVIHDEEITITGLLDSVTFQRLG